MMKPRLQWLFAAVLALPLSQAWAAPSFTNTSHLSFGKFVPGSGGTITIAPNGARTANGDVLPLISSAGSAGEFIIAESDPGFANQAYTITLPSDDTVVLSGTNGTMAVNGFTSSPSETGTLSGGTQTVTIGATLSVSANQPAGAYSGSFSVIINYY